MKKTAFKTFVCSFVFSLFILFTINGLFFYTPEATSQNVKIPSKNISLFFMGAAGGAHEKQRYVFAGNFNVLRGCFRGIKKQSVYCE